MKNLLKIGALSLALLASIFLLSNDTTNAGEVTLKITGTPGYCVVGSDVPFGTQAFSYDSYSMTTGFASTIGNYWECNDSNGVGSWSVQISSSNLENIATNNPAHTISNSNVEIKVDTPELVAGQCTPNLGNATSWTSISSPVVLFGKSNAAGEVCTIRTNSVQMRLTIPASQALGDYVGTLTIDVPSL